MPTGPDKKQKQRRLIITMAYILLTLIVITTLNSSLSPQKEEVSYSKLLEMGQNGEIKEIIIEGSTIYAIPHQEESTSIFRQQKIYFAISIGDDEGFADYLESWNLESYGGSLDDEDSLFTLIMSWIFPLALMLGVWYFIFRQMGKRMGNPMSFGKNNEKVYAEKNTGVTFDDVAGQDESKTQLIEIVDFLHKPEKFTEIGAKMPKGALLVGPPGTGKTLLARAVAGEAKVPFFSMSGPEFVQMFVGVGASRVRDLFTQAQDKAPCIIFIDEIDAIGKSRATQGVSNDEREQTLNQLLTEMDGFDANKGVVILAATNRPEVLDPALLRPGRFDRRVIVERPDLAGREAILQVHSKKVRLDEDVNLNEVAKTTSGAVGADLANIVNEAALLAVKRSHEAVKQEDFMEAIEVNMAGMVKKDRILSDKEKRAVSYHEVGHALVAAKLEHADQVHKITIVPRTKGALGYTMQLPAEEKYLVTKDEMLDQVCVMLGGRAAEEEALNQISTGASNDIERATQSVRRMITLYGMSDEFDMMGLETIASAYLNGQLSATCSPETQARVDALVLSIIREQHQRARQILHDNEQVMNECADYLLENETITGEEFMHIVQGTRNEDSVTEEP